MAERPLAHRQAMWQWWLLSMAAMTAGDMTCLEDAIAPAERKNLSNTEGESYPLGIWISSWASGQLTAAMAQILIEEKIGFHVRTGQGSVTLEQMWAITGCKTPGNLSDPGCGSDGPKQTYFHLGMEGWTNSNAEIWDLIQNDFPATAPVNLGHIGYDGQGGAFISLEVMERAYRTAGLALEFYRSYDVAWNDPGVHFDRITAVDSSQLKPCNETKLWESSVIQNYAEVTGDWDGVEEVDGKVRGKCSSERFWFPPPCRADATKCFLFITVLGYEFEVAMQRATIFNMPIVPGEARDWDTYARLPKTVTSLFYWWQPDPTFLGLNAKIVSFPAFNRTSFEQGLMISASTGIQLDKYVSRDLEVLAPTVRELISAFHLSMDALNRLLLTQKIHSSSAMEVACSWLQSNRKIWEQWLPDTTKCFAQLGLFNQVTEAFVDNREGDVSNLLCKACSSGSFSASIRDDKGLTNVCRPCAVGHAQSSGASTACEPCALGEHQEELGASFCRRCTFGTYQNVTGQSQCTDCPSERTTMGLGAQSLVECVCKAGSIDVDGQCVPCGKGLSCPIGSTIAGLTLLPSANASNSDVERPFVKPGFNSLPQAPLTIFRCRDHCPGGVPGTCSFGRIGAVCGECPAGSYASSLGPCWPCQKHTATLWLTVGGVVLLPGMFLAYHVLTKPYTAKNEASGIVGCLLGLFAETVQNLLVISAAPTTWPPVMMGMATYAGVATLNLEALGLACVGSIGNIGVVGRYFCQTLVFPSMVGILLLTFGFTRLLPRVTRGCRCAPRALACYERLAKIFHIPPLPPTAYSWTWYGTVCVIGKFCQVTFPTMANVGLSPMMCYKHPGGQHSLTKYSNTFCGTSDHVIMLSVGTVSLTFTTGFLALCIWAACKAPQFSWQGQAAVKFLFADFRPDVAWFGIVTLSRGLLLSLPSVAVPNRPNVQLVLLHTVMLLSLVLQGYCQPWKSPAVNLVDATSQFFFLTLLGLGLGGLESESDWMLDIVGTSVCIGILVVFVVAISVFALVVIMEKLGRQGIGERCANLGRIPESRILLRLLQNLASSIENSTDLDSVKRAMDELGTYDVRMILLSLTILEMETGLSATSSARDTQSRQSARSRTSEMSHLSLYSESNRIGGRALAASAVSKRRASHFAVMQRAISPDQDLLVELGSPSDVQLWDSEKVGQNDADVLPDPDNPGDLESVSEYF